MWGFGLAKRAQFSKQDPVFSLSQPNLIVKQSPRHPEKPPANPPDESSYFALLQTVATVSSCTSDELASHETASGEEKVCSARGATAGLAGAGAGAGLWW